MFRSSLFDHSLSCLVPLLHFRLFASSSCLSGMWLYLVYMCLSDVLVCRMSGCEFTIRYVPVCCLYVCVSDVLVCRMSGCEFTIRYVAICCLYVCVSDVLVCRMSGCEVHNPVCGYMLSICVCVQCTCL
jgi:hypothetical protein